MHFPILRNSGVLHTTETHNNLDEFPENYSEREKEPIPKVYLVYGFIYVIFLK